MASAALLTGCGVRYDPGPRYTVKSFFLYVRLGAWQSAWQDLAPDLQEPRRSVPLRWPGRPAGTDLGFPSYRAFPTEARKLRARLVPTVRIAMQRTLDTADVEVTGRSGWRGNFSLVRVDNEWIVTRILLLPPR